MDVVALSKQLSRILRHRPDAASVRLDSHGWCDVDELLRGLAELGIPATREAIEQVVRENDKKRFVLEGELMSAREFRYLREWKQERCLFSPVFEEGNRKDLEAKGLACRDLNDFARMLTGEVATDAPAAALGGQRT